MGRPEGRNYLCVARVWDPRCPPHVTHTSLSPGHVKCEIRDFPVKLGAGASLGTGPDLERTFSPYLQRSVSVRRRRGTLDPGGAARHIFSLIPPPALRTGGAKLIDSIQGEAANKLKLAVAKNYEDWGGITGTPPTW